MKKFICYTKVLLISYQLLGISNPIYAQTKGTSGNSDVEQFKTKLNISELTLPSEVSNLGKQRGAMYYSPTVKDKILIPVHIWGEVKNTGLHYVPIGTSLINGISLAGGPATNAVLSDVKLTRSLSEKTETKEFNLEDGGNKEAYYEKLQAGDTIFIKKSHFYEDRAYYTGLIAIFSTVLSSILLYREVKK